MVYGLYNFWTSVKSNTPDVWNWNFWTLFGSEIEVRGRCAQWYELVENRKTLILNHEDALESINDKIDHVFGSLLNLLTAIEEEKQMAMEDITSQNRDNNPLMEVPTLFEKSILFLEQAFNAVSYFKRRVWYLI